MADSKTSLLTETSAPALDDYTYLVDTSDLSDGGASGSSRKLSLSRLLGLVGAMPGGRLTTESGVAISTSDRTAQSTLYYTPNVSDYLRLWDGARVKEYSCPEISLALSGLTSGKIYDAFVYDNAGTPTLISSAAWTNDTTRANALTWQTGLGWVKSGVPSQLWLGTLRATGATTVEDSAAKRFLWNAYNQVTRKLSVIDSGNWTLASSAVWSQRGTKQVEVVVGGATVVDLALSVFAVPGASGYAAVAIGRDSTTVMDGVSGQANAPGLASISARLRSIESLGYHYYAWLETAGTATASFYASNAGPTQQYATLDGLVRG